MYKQNVRLKVWMMWARHTGNEHVIQAMCTSYRQWARHTGNEHVIQAMSTSYRQWARHRGNEHVIQAMSTSYRQWARHTGNEHIIQAMDIVNISVMYMYMALFNNGFKSRSFEGDLFIKLIPTFTFLLFFLSYFIYLCNNSMTCKHPDINVQI